MKTVKVRLAVILDDHGNLVGTAPPAMPADGHASGVQSRVVAGPGQRMHEIELQLDEALLARRDIDAVHARVREHLAGTRKAGKKTK